MVGESLAARRRSSGQQSHRHRPNIRQLSLAGDA
jgi:hypothetical protein